MATYIDVVWDTEDGRIRRWIVANGSRVKAGDVLATCEPTSYQLKAPTSGEIKLKIGGSTNVRQNDIVATIVVCSHEIQYHGVCLSCNADLSYDMENIKRQYSSVVNPLDAAIRRSESSVMEEFEQNKQKLLESKKLWMLLDLDQTILHTTMLGEYVDLSKDICIPHEKLEDTYIFRTKDSNIPHIVNFRPGVKEFLLEISEYYEIHIYTSGSMPYANSIVHILKNFVLKDVDKNVVNRIFGSRVITRDHTKNANQKDILKVIPFKDMVVILDDSPQVWVNYDSYVIKVKRYFFFKDTIDMNALHGKKLTSKTKKRKRNGDKEAESDDEVEESDYVGQVAGTDLWYYKSYKNDSILSVMFRILKRVHEKYYEDEEEIGKKDCGKILKNIRRGVLYGAKLCFSSMIPLEEDIKSSYLWKLARMYGAECFSELDEKNSHGISHLVSKFAGTEKVTRALTLENIYVVNEHWFWNSVDYWKWQDETNYPLPNLPTSKSPPVFDIREELPWDEESLEDISEEEVDEENIKEEAKVEAKDEKAPVTGSDEEIYDLIEELSL